MTGAKNINQSPVQQGEVMIHVENLKKSFGDNVVLNGITQDIRKGEKVVIIGPSGSGKSTFLRCLNLLEVPTSGHIIFEGTDLTDKDTDINAIRRKMGMVFQHFNLFPNMTVRRNITLAPVRTRTRKQSACWRVSAFSTRLTPIPQASPADRNSVSRSSARWP